MFALNKSLLLIDDVERFSRFFLTDRKTGNVGFKPTDKPASLYQQSVKNLQMIEKAIEEDYEVFLTAGDREKEDIILEWEGIAKEIGNHLNPYRDEDKFSADWISILENIKTFSDKILAFEQKLKDEFYGDLNKTYSQEYLKEFSKKFAHLPQDLLDSLASDEYPELKA